MGSQDKTHRHTLDRLAATIRERKMASPDQSHTAGLIGGGVDHCARKYGEEAVETVVALVRGDKPAIVREAADAVYHLLVALEVSGVSFDEVLRELDRRTSQSGVDEKAGRRQ